MFDPNETQNLNLLGVKELKITALDGYVLGATLYQAKRPQGVVVINSATAVPQEYYKKFAQFLAGEELSVVTYDYRGIGKSRRVSTLRGFRATYTDWATQDAQAVLDWAFENHGPNLFVIGHSFGGQLLGLTSQNERIKKTILVGAQSGYWRNFPLKSQWWLFLLWFLILPGLTKIFGYFPAKWLGLGEDMPGGAALQWAGWCRSPRYLMTSFENEGDNKFKNLKSVRAYEILDDTYAPPTAVRALIPYLKSKTYEIVTLDPKLLRAKIGHFGFFREKFKTTLWCEVRDFFAEASSI